MTTETSIIPAVTFLLPIVAGASVLLWKRIDRRLQQVIPILTAALVTAMAAWMAYQGAGGVVLTTWNSELRVDALSALMVA